ncbi:hypothetical protein B0H12DRAFT_1079007 [Mycena haematopus]|nr:hypothetical protein B0H12DRAFT_1079007 [Mycena haematopus]
MHVRNNHPASGYYEDLQALACLQSRQQGSSGWPIATWQVPQFQSVEMSEIRSRNATVERQPKESNVPAPGHLKIEVGFRNRRLRDPKLEKEGHANPVKLEDEEAALDDEEVDECEDDTETSPLSGGQLSATQDIPGAVILPKQYHVKVDETF